jgi:serine/threonine protein kinase/HAMP domain-containing protein
MDWLRFTNYSIPNLTQLILALAITHAMLRVEKKSLTTRWLIFGFLMLSLSYVSLLITFSVLRPWINYLLPIQILPGVISGIAILQFFYLFPRPHHQREAKIVLIATVIIAIICAAISGHVTYIWASTQSVTAFRKHFLEVQFIVLARIVETIWGVAMLLRQTIALSKNEQASENAKLTLPERFLLALKYIIKPIGKDAATTRTFAALYIFITFLYIAIGYVYQSSSFDFWMIIINTGLLLYIFIFISIYLNNSPDPTAIKTKLTLSTLTIMLVMLGMVGIITIPGYSQSYKSRCLSEAQQSIKAAQAGNVQEISAIVMAIYADAAPTSNQAAHYQEIFRRSNFKPKNFNLEVLAKGDNTPAQMEYKLVGDDFYDSVISLLLLDKGKKYQIWFDAIEGRAYFHERIYPFVLLILAATLITYISVPYILSGLLRPLDNLLTGVKKVDDGDLNVAVPIRSRDEIGHLITSFNKMVRSVKKAKDEELKLIALEKEEAIKAIELKRKIEENQELAKKNEELIALHKKADRIFCALAEALPGTVLDGKYRLDEKIGIGGFGVVYRATHLAMKRAIAVKVFKPAPGNDSVEGLERFQQEAISTCRVNHPNAVAILDSGISSEGIAYLVMELLQGHTLRQELTQRRILPIKRAVQIMLPICDLLAKAHAAGIIHRDIKPDNIFLHYAPEGEVVKVVDFGIAKLMKASGGKNLTATGGIIGTPAYMAPERLANQNYDGRADVYSLGVMLYEMVCGQAPFSSEDETIWSLVMRRLSSELPSPRNFNAEIPTEMETIIIRSLAKEADARPGARELGQLLATTVGAEFLDSDSNGLPAAYLSNSDNIKTAHFESAKETSNEEDAFEHAAMKKSEN